MKTSFSLTKITCGRRPRIITLKGHKDGDVPFRSVLPAPLPPPHGARLQEQGRGSSRARCVNVRTRDCEPGLQALREPTWFQQSRKYTGVFAPGNTAAQRKVHVLGRKKRMCMKWAMSPGPQEKVTGKAHRTQAGAELEDGDPIHGRGPQGTSRVPPHHTPSLTHGD